MVISWSLKQSLSEAFIRARCKADGSLFKVFTNYRSSSCNSLTRLRYWHLVIKNWELELCKNLIWIEGKSGMTWSYLGRVRLRNLYRWRWAPPISQERLECRFCLPLETEYMHDQLDGGVELLRYDKPVCLLPDFVGLHSNEWIDEKRGAQKGSWHGSPIHVHWWRQYLVVWREKKHMMCFVASSVHIFNAICYTWEARIQESDRTNCGIQAWG